MAKFRRRTCIILSLFILSVFSLMMGLKMLRPDRAVFGDPLGLDLLPDLRKRTSHLRKNFDSQRNDKINSEANTKNLKSLGITMKPSKTSEPSLGEQSPLNYYFHVFYYSWYGNPQFDGKYIHWNHPILKHWDSRISKDFPQGRHSPPDDIGSSFYPELGSYSSRDPSVIEVHMKQIHSASIGVLALSWYPPNANDENGIPTDDLVPTILDKAHKYNLKVTFHIEPYNNRDDKNMHENVKYIIDKYGGHPAFYRYKTKTGKALPMFYVYDSYVTKPEKWANLLTSTGSQSIRSSPYDGLFIALLVEYRQRFDILRSGFDGMYTYFATNGFTYGSSYENWGKLKFFCDQFNLMFIPSVGPGYIDTSIRPWNSQNTRNRVNGKYYENALSAALQTHPSLVSITSFNEWHEGTQIERAVPKRTSQTVYLDYRPHKPSVYLELTRKWAEKYSKERATYVTAHQPPVSQDGV
ncbi:glycoprotein endo-alpha-1,2-mannosidase [Erinaceus europaeus]|uniref:Glycoprotein endo-alpha-1,2-mannosidase n=1 Tax=Erinaceus europaeus TaxID=9365 RepID=A0A1S2ZSF0_ERIEU|nr:glycoprotein endo-alpha-1,2-mannosidase [Erinaceus europaeus]XP_060044655.1 glycoprotein endo-alpha-1,2-mannosidase [Erinaceus europaeus]XP_060044656.1 glycoprotein endo-alpha-1,2-mannosidase [Erinaceus europaeus]